MIIYCLCLHFNSLFTSSPQNLIAQSQSGTGKTAAFVLAMLSHVDPNNKYPQVCIHFPCCS